LGEVLKTAIGLSTIFGTFLTVLFGLALDYGWTIVFLNISSSSRDKMKFRWQLHDISPVFNHDHIRISPGKFSRRFSETNYMKKSVNFELLPDAAIADFPAFVPNPI
jgi:hypothetical protein